VCWLLVENCTWPIPCHDINSKINVVVTFNNLVINALLTRDYHVKMLVTFLEAFWLWFDTSVTVKHPEQAILCVAAAEQ